MTENFVIKKFIGKRVKIFLNNTHVYRGKILDIKGDYLLIFDDHNDKVYLNINYILEIIPE